MSGNVEDEARARLDVAQLYEDMGQIPKAIRYYLEAAQIYRDGGVGGRHRELCNKVLRLEPDNAQAQAELQQAHAAANADTPSTSPPATASASTAAVASTTTTSAGSQTAAKAGGLAPLQLPKPQPGKVLIPTPWLFRDPRYVHSAKKQLTTPLNRSQLPFDPLPQVDPQMVMIRQEQRKKAEEEAERKRNPRRESAFGDRERPSLFTSKKATTQDQSAKPVANSAASASNPTPQAPTPQAPTPGGGRAGNLDLAEAIRRRMLEKGK